MFDGDSGVHVSDRKAHFVGTCADTLPFENYREIPMCTRRIRTYAHLCGSDDAGYRYHYCSNLLS